MKSFSFHASTGEKANANTDVTAFSAKYNSACVWSVFLLQRSSLCSRLRVKPPAPKFGKVDVSLDVVGQVCNHPDLFEGRPIISSFDVAGIEAQLPSPALSALQRDVWKSIDLTTLNLVPVEFEGMAQWEANTLKASSQWGGSLEC